MIHSTMYVKDETYLIRHVLQLDSWSKGGDVIVTGRKRCAFRETRTTHFLLAGQMS